MFYVFNKSAGEWLQCDVNLLTDFDLELVFFFFCNRLLVILLICFEKFPSFSCLDA